MARVRNIQEIMKNMKPTVSPVTKKYIIVNWVNIYQEEKGVVMRNFETSKLYTGQDGKIYLSDFPSELCLTPKDANTFGILIKNRYRVWFKCISDPRMLAIDRNRFGIKTFEEGEIEEIMGQSGYICIQINNSEQQRIFTAYYLHMGYNVRIVEGFPWQSDERNL